MADCHLDAGCVDYNVRSRPFGALGLWAFLLGGPLGIRWRAPLLLTLPYFAYRALRANGGGGGGEIFDTFCAFLYSLGMFWSHLVHAYNTPSFRRDCWLGAVWFVSYQLACGRAEAVGVTWLVRDAAFVPLYFVSLVTLYRKEQWVWLSGLAFGWAGPVILLSSGTHVYAFVDTLAGRVPILYLFDGFVTFPVMLIGIILAGRTGLRGGIIEHENERNMKKKTS